MKMNLKYLFWVGLVGFWATACNFLGEKGNGNLTKERRSVEGFTKINASNGLTVFVEIGKQERVEVETDENLQDLIVTKVSGNTLEIYTTKPISEAKATNVFVTATGVEGLSASSGATLKVEHDNIKTNTLNLRASSGSDLAVSAATVMDFQAKTGSGGYISIEKLGAQKAFFEASSGSEIKVIGNATEVSAEVSSGATIKAGGLKATNCRAEASSSGEVQIEVMEGLNATVSSGGSVHYKGSPTSVSKKESSGGVVKQL